MWFPNVLVALGIFVIVAGIALGAGFLALSAASLPAAVFTLAALMIYSQQPLSTSCFSGARTKMHLS